MTTTHRTRPHTTTAPRNGRRGPNAQFRSPAQQPRARRVIDGLVASYVHDISTRHASAVPTAAITEPR